MDWRRCQSPSWPGRVAAWDTRVGQSSWPFPGCGRARTSPSFLEPRWRAEQALVDGDQEAYVNGVSTPRVDRLVERLGVAGFGKDQVSRLCRGTRNGSS
jgi:transposase-like protein